MSTKGLSALARNNTRSQVWYEGRCWKCGTGPDLDGHEWRLTEEDALRAAIDEAEWAIQDGVLYCEDCRDE